jgi:hypothetical protein
MLVPGAFEPGRRAIATRKAEMPIPLEQTGRTPAMPSGKGVGDVPPFTGAGARSSGPSARGSILRQPAPRGRGSCPQPRGDPERRDAEEEVRMTRRLATGQLIGLVVVVVMGMAVGAASRSRETVITIDDFEDGDRIAANGSPWLGMGDDLIGGKTSLRLETIKGGARSSRGALHFSGTLGEGPGAFAYALAPVLEGTRPADLGQLTGVRLQVRSAADVLVGFGGKASSRWP